MSFSRSPSMKNLLLLLSAVVVISCGSKNNNQVNSGAAPTDSNIDGLEVFPVNFEGSYDIRNGQPAENCPASINITKGCDGFILTSNTNQKEDFCNVNTNTANSNKVVVTLQDNQLKAVVRVGQNVYSNTLTLDKNRYLTKVTDYKSRSNLRCVFEKR